MGTLKMRMHWYFCLWNMASAAFCLPVKTFKVLSAVALLLSTDP
jgi:hypothetical protein